MANDTLGALRYILEMYHFLAVPVFDGTDADRSAYAEDVIAITGSEQRVVGIPVTLRKLELRLSFAIGVDGLFLIEINAVRHEFGLHRHAVMVKRMIDILFLVGRLPLGDGVAMTHLRALIEDGIALSGRIGRSTDSPERGSYPRGAARKKDRYAQSQKTANAQRRKSLSAFDF